MEAKIHPYAYISSFPQDISQNSEKWINICPDMRDRVL